jgi:hypothetical protein
MPNMNAQKETKTSALRLGEPERGKLKGEYYEGQIATEEIFRQSHSCPADHSNSIAMFCRTPHSAALITASMRRAL